jgi:hypothetical protein
MRKRISLLLTVSFVLALLANICIAGDDTKETFSAFLNPTGTPTGATTPIQIVIKQFTSDDDANQYKGVLKSEGQNALMEKIKKNNVGFCRIGDNIGQTLLAARSVLLPSGDRRVTAIYGSVTGNYQVRQASKVGEYPFAFVEMVIKPDGKGEGMLVPAIGARVKDDGSLDLESFGAYPLRMMNLHQEGKK